MHIGVLTTSFPRHERDIAGHFVRASCQALIARGHTIDVLVPDASQARTAIDPNGLRVTPITYLWPRSQQHTFYGAGVPDNLQRDPRAWLGLAPFSAALAWNVRSRAQAWDAVISHWALPCGLAATLRPTRCRHLSVLHSADVHLLSRLPARRALAKAIVGSASHLWFTSDALRSKFAATLEAPDQQRMMDKSHCGAMGVETPLPVDAIETLRTRLRVRNKVALVMGRLVAIKGVERAITAVAGTDVQLIVAGDGPERARLQALAAPLGDQVRFVGIVTGRAKAEWLSVADVMLLPSIVLHDGRTEGVPVSAIEAMSYGCPVIGSDVGGIGELVQHEHNGWLVAPDDPRGTGAMRLVLQALDRTTRHRLGQNARAAVQHRQWSELAQTWEKLL